MRLCGRTVPLLLACLAAGLLTGPGTGATRSDTAVTRPWKGTIVERYRISGNTATLTLTLGRRIATNRYGPPWCSNRWSVCGTATGDLYRARVTGEVTSRLSDGPTCRGVQRWSSAATGAISASVFISPTGRWNIFALSTRYPVVETRTGCEANNGTTRGFTCCHDLVVQGPARPNATTLVFREGTRRVSLRR